MNIFLLDFATKLPKIRELLKFTQDDLSKKAGISKPTLVGIENDPQRLTKAQALALFAVIASELEQRETSARTIDYTNMPVAAAAINALGLSAKLFNSLLPALTTGSMNGTPFSTLSSMPTFLKTVGKSSSLDPSTLRRLVDSSLAEIRKQIIDLAGLQSLSVSEFFMKIEESKPE
jgi:DNA-binding XRE family transcriptional regulator